MNPKTYNTLYYDSAFTETIINFSHSFRLYLAKYTYSHTLSLQSNLNLHEYNQIEGYNNSIERITSLFDKLYTTDKDIKLHLFDNNGTIAIAQPDKNQIWINPTRENTNTSFHFNFEIANTDSLTKVNRKETLILNDWIWNLFWNSSEVAIALCPSDGHFKINYWPKPSDIKNKKIIFQLSACFIQGGKISTIADQLNLPHDLVRQFIGANITIDNVEKINIWDKHYSPPTSNTENEDVSFIKDFFSNLRKTLRL